MQVAGIENVDGTAYADVIRGTVRATCSEVPAATTGSTAMVGRDRAEGGSGHDTCVAEQRISC